MNLSDLAAAGLPARAVGRGRKDSPATIRRSAGGCWPSTSRRSTATAASRRDGIIDAQVDWIDRELLGRGLPRARPRLWAGPLHTQRLEAARGHVCHGIDFGLAAPAPGPPRRLATAEPVLGPLLR